MKVLNYLAMAVIALVAVSCSSDDENEVKVNPETVAGTYMGDAELSVMGSSQGNVKAIKLVFAAKGDGLTIDIPALSVPGMKPGSTTELPAFTLEGVKLAKDGASVSVASDTLSFTIGEKAYQVFCVGNVKGAKFDGTFGIQMGKMPAFFTFDYVGNLIPEGRFAGKANMLVGGESQGVNDVVLTLDSLTADSVRVSFPEVGFGKMVLVPFSVKVGVKENNGEYSMNLALTELVLQEAQKNYTVKFEGTFKAGALKAKYSIKPGKMPMFIDFEFSNK